MMIENLGKQLKQSADHVQVASSEVADVRDDLMIGQGMLMGVAANVSPDSKLQTVIEAYGQAVEALNTVLGHLSLTGRGIITVADTMGRTVRPLYEQSNPTLKVIDIPEPPPAEGDRGTTQPFQFEVYVQMEQQIADQLAAGIPAESIRGYITRGGTCYIFQTPDFKIIKIPHPIQKHFSDQTTLPKADIMWYSYAEALKLGKGIKGLEQFVAYIDGKGKRGRGAVVSEMALSYPLSEFDPEEVNNIPRAHFDNLIVTFRAMEARGLYPDVDPANVIYDWVKGFTVIDYSTLKERNSMELYGDLVGDARTLALKFAHSLICAVEGDKQAPAIATYLAAYERAFGAAATQKVREGLL